MTSDAAETMTSQVTGSSDSARAILGRGGAPGRPVRKRLLAAAAAAAVLGIGGASLAIALSANGHKPPRQTGSTQTHGAPAGHRATSKVSPAAVPLAQFKVCTFPAVTCTADSAVSMKTEPSTIITSGDGSGYLKDLTWSGWGRSTTQAAGMLEVDNCNPSCAGGTYTGYQAAVKLSGLTPYGSNGKEAYADMVVSAPSASDPTETFRTGLVP